MGRIISTLFGDMDEDLLEVKDIVQNSSNARSVATEWRLKGDLTVDGKLIEVFLPNGEIVFGLKGAVARRDAAVSIFHPDPPKLDQGELY